MSLYLMNDDENSFENVIYILQKNVPLCNSLRAEQIARLVHESGKCHIHTGYPPEIYIIYAQLQKSGLTVQLEINKKS
jgi:ATP-dependent Clp protease adapter protein ClpS